MARLSQYFFSRCTALLLTITFTGLAIFFYLYLPWGMQKIYPENPYQYFTEIRTKTVLENQSIQPAQNLAIEKLLSQVQQSWGNQPLSTMSVKIQIPIKLKLHLFKRRPHYYSKSASNYIKCFNWQSLSRYT